MMSQKCDICGKKAGWGPTLRCTVCGKTICRRHDKEQFVATSVQSDLSVIDTMGTVLNYPSGESLKEQEFKCYRCRTGKEPADMGIRGRDPVALILILMAVSSLILFVAFMVTAVDILIIFIIPDVAASLVLMYFLGKRDISAR